MSTRRYLPRLNAWDGTVMRNLEYAGGIVFQSTWNTPPAVEPSQQIMNGAFPDLLRVGTGGFTVMYGYYLAQMDNMANALTRVDGNL